MEDQRKRTLEALERRFAQAEAEIRTQQQKSKKRPIQDKDKLASTIESSPVNTATKKPFPNTSSRKDANEPAYFKLSHPVHEILLPTAAEDFYLSIYILQCRFLMEKPRLIDRVLHELFQHGDLAQKYMQGYKSMKIENTILVDNFVQKSGKSNGARTYSSNAEWLQALKKAPVPEAT